MMCRAEATLPLWGALDNMVFCCRRPATLTIPGCLRTLSTVREPVPTTEAGGSEPDSPELSLFGDKRVDFRKSTRCPAAVPVLLALGLGACASVGGVSESSPPDAKRAAVIERADSRGAALVRGDLDGAYQYLSEGSKAVISLDNFKRRMSLVPFTAYRIDDASCDGGTCTVRSKLTYNHRLMKGITTPVTETWVIENGKLFYVFPTG